MEKKSRLPKKFGSIRKLGGRRKNPYAVHPTMAAGPDDPAGTAKKRRTLCYVPDWETGYKVLVLYNAGKYEKGMERDLALGQPVLENVPADPMLIFARKVLEGIEVIQRGGRVSVVFEEISEGVKDDSFREGSSGVKTFSSVYASFYKHKFGPHAARPLTRETEIAYRSAWMKLTALHRRTLDEVNIDELEGLVCELTDAGYSKTTVSRVVTLIRQLYRYALDRGYCRRKHGLHIVMPKAREENHRQAFSDEELGKLWRAYHFGQGLIRDVSRMVLINCYSGFRIREFLHLELVEQEIPYFRGGFKTDFGRNRIVPVHSSIRPLVREIMKDGRPQYLCGKSYGQFRRDMKKVLLELRIDGVGEDGEERYHTPHSCRHTFSRLCESYQVHEADRKRMLGHSLRNDVTNGIYGHRTVFELCEQLEKIPGWQKA